MVDRTGEHCGASPSADRGRSKMVLARINAGAKRKVVISSFTIVAACSIRPLSPGVIRTVRF
jgi:hypothetical protein